MQIAFDEIITKANARKELLVKLTDQLSTANALADQLYVAYNKLYGLFDIWRQLDQEGRQLLPREVQQCMNAVHCHSDALARILENDEYGLVKLVRAVNAASQPKED